MLCLDGNEGRMCIRIVWYGVARSRPTCQTATAKCQAWSFEDWGIQEHSSRAPKLIQRAAQVGIRERRFLVNDLGRPGIELEAFSSTRSFNISQLFSYMGSATSSVVRRWFCFRCCLSF